MERNGHVPAPKRFRDRTKAFPIEIFLVAATAVFLKSERLIRLVAAAAAERAHLRKYCTIWRRLATHVRINLDHMDKYCVSTKKKARKHVVDEARKEPLYGQGPRPIDERRHLRLTQLHVEDEMETREDHVGARKN